MAAIASVSGVTMTRFASPCGWRGKVETDAQSRGDHANGQDWLDDNGTSLIGGAQVGLGIRQNG
jgi:hypothetical protein